MIRTDGPSITTANKLTGNDQMFYVKKFKDIVVEWGNINPILQTAGDDSDIMG